MFLTVLGGSLALGAGLLAAAGYSDGALVTTRTAALTIGWLLLLAAVIGVQGMRRGRLAEIGTTLVVLVSGVGVLYVSYFDWTELPEPPFSLVAADVLPESEMDMKLDAAEPLAASAGLGSSAPALARAVIAPPTADKPLAEDQPVLYPCAQLPALEALQCRRCAGKSGFARLMCHESARLEYCEGSSAEAVCASAIPSANLDSPPG